MKWLFHENNVERLCARIIQKHGPETANEVLRLCKQLDTGLVLDLESIDDKEFRKRIRHLCEAFCLTPTKQIVVPGITPVGKAFKKPEECELKLAKVVKPLMLKAVEQVLREQAREHVNKRLAAPPTEETIAQKEVEISEDRLELQRRLMESLTAGGNPEEGPQVEAEEEGEETLSEEGRRKAGIMSLEEYKEMRERGEEVVPMYTRGTAPTEESDENQKSLMDLRKEGIFKESVADVMRYEDLRRQQGEMWGKSQREQQRQMSKQKRRKLEGQQNEDDEDEPWVRFDREKVFAATRQGTSKAQFEELMELTAEHAANFKKA